MAENGTSTVMLKGIFEQLAEGHELPKKLAQDLLAGMIESVTWHLKQGDRIRIGGLGHWKCGSAKLARDATQPWARFCKSRPAKRLHSVRPRS